MCSTRQKCRERKRERVSPAGSIKGGLKGFMKDGVIYYELNEGRNTKTIELKTCKCVRRGKCKE